MPNRDLLACEFCEELIPHGVIEERMKKLESEFVELKKEITKELRLKLAANCEKESE